MGQITEIDALKAVDEALSALDDEAKSRVLNWATSKYSGLVQATAPPVQLPPGQNTAPKKTKKIAKAGASKKIKTIIKQDKSLNMSPKGKTSAVDYMTQKAPSNMKEKCVVAVYYLLNVAELPAATVDQVYTLFKHVGWEVPADLRNALQQAGTAGWLDTAIATDLKVTSSGENLVEHRLPKPEKKGSK